MFHKLFSQAFLEAQLFYYFRFDFCWKWAMEDAAQVYFAPLTRFWLRQAHHGPLHPGAGATALFRNRLKNKEIKWKWLSRGHRYPANSAGGGYQLAVVHHRRRTPRPGRWGICAPHQNGAHVLQSHPAAVTSRLFQSTTVCANNQREFLGANKMWHRTLWLCWGDLSQL